MSLADLAGVIHYGKGYLSKLETGAKPPTPEAAVACDTALGAEGALLALGAAGQHVAPSGSERGRPPGVGDPEVLGSSHVADPVSVARGWSLVDLGRFEERARILDEGVARLRLLRTHSEQLGKRRRLPPETGVF